VSLGRSAAIGVGAGVLAGLIAHQLFGVPLHWAILFGLATGTLAMLAASLAGMMDANWDAVPNPITTAPELRASSMAIRFAEAANDQHRFMTRVRPRLCQLALTILRARPGTEDLTSLEDPRAREALGVDLHALLTDARAVLPGPRQLAMMLARLEEL
jgi:hypothetical protein